MGNHLELIKLNGIYKQLMEKQINEKENEVKDDDDDNNIE